MSKFHPGDRVRIANILTVERVWRGKIGTVNSEHRIVGGYLVDIDNVATVFFTEEELRPAEIYPQGGDRDE